MHFEEGSQVLFVGEGDFSFITSLTREDRCSGVHLTATALQEELSERAKGNVELLKERGIRVTLGVNATRLHLHPLIQHCKYTHIVFNFPHIGGKMRIERNRKLLRDFFSSAVQVLEVGGCVVVTLCGGQGGVTLDPKARRYDDSWKVVLMASHADLVLRSIQKFALESYPGYSATGYRSLEKGFCQDAALTYVFQVCKLSPAPEDALLTQNVYMCDGSSLHLPAFLHSQIQRDIVADTSSLIGHFYNLLLGLLRESHLVHCGEKLVFRKEHQKESLRKFSKKLRCRTYAEVGLRKSMTVPKCESPSVPCSEKLMLRKEDEEQSLRNYSKKIHYYRKHAEEKSRKSEAISKSRSLQEPTDTSHLTYRGKAVKGGGLEISDNLSFQCGEKPVFGAEGQEESLTCKSGSKYANLPRPQPIVFSHSACRVNMDGSLRLEPFIIIICPGNTEVIEDTLSQPQNTKIRNVSKSFTSQVKTFTFGDFIEDTMCFSDSNDFHDTATCYLISVTSLARECVGMDEDEVWGSGQSVSKCDEVLTYSPFSLFPGEFIYDFSFWETKSSRSKNDAMAFNSPKERDAIVFDPPKDGDSVDGVLITSESDIMMSNSMKNKSSADTISTRNEVTASLNDESLIGNIVTGCKREVAISLYDKSSNDTVFINSEDEVIFSSNVKSSLRSVVSSDSEVKVCSNNRSVNDSQNISCNNDICFSNNKSSIDHTASSEDEEKVPLNYISSNDTLFESSLGTPLTKHRSQVKAPPHNRSSLDNNITGNDCAFPALSSITNSSTNHTCELMAFPKYKTSLDTIITNMGREALRSYKLLSVYDHRELGRRSYTYRLVYRSWRAALSDQEAKEIHSCIGRQLEKCLGVEVR